MNILWQQDPRWKDIKLGNSPYSLQQSGCFVTVIAEILETTPDVINRRLFEDGGFAKDVDGYNDLVEWNQLSRIFSGITTRYQSPYNNADVLAELAKGNSIIVSVSGKPIGGIGVHAVRYIGNRKLHDPWTGKERPTSDFGMGYSYVVIGGKWQVSQEVPTGATVAVDKDVFTRIVTKATNNDNLLTALNLSPDLGAQPDSYKQVLAYIQDFITAEVAKRAPIISTPSVPPTPSITDSPLEQAKSLWQKDLLEVLAGIFKKDKEVKV